MEILALNSISKVADDVFKTDFKIVKESASPVGIILRSFKMHDYDLPKSVLCVARAGAGTNNIPSDKYADQGVVVFNTPGANANAVKELVILSLLLCGRKVIEGIAYSQSLNGKGAEVEKLVESGKGAYVGGEILEKKLGVIGLGAIGMLSANAAAALGMEVVGFDPYIKDEFKEKLDKSIKIVKDLNEIYKSCDYISLHTPLNDATKQMINADTIALMKDGVNIVNCSRGELVDNDALKAALSAGKVNRYVIDFPTQSLLGVENVVAIPHLGASTYEAEDNCAEMAAAQTIEYIKNGNVVNSVNFPNCKLEKSGKYRITVLSKSNDKVLDEVKNVLSKDGIKVANSKTASNSKGYSTTIVDCDKDVNDKTIGAINGILKVHKV